MRLLVIALVVVGVVLAIAAYRSVQPELHQASSTQQCSPKPCAAPQGFEAYVSNLREANGLLTMQVRFVNHTRPQTFEAVSYRHTSPADFQLRDRTGIATRPVFVGNACRDWPEVDVPRGAATGPEPICFKAPSGGLKGATLIWSPDLGLLFQDVTIPLS